jgi:hypothetical protein
MPLLLHAGAEVVDYDQLRTLPTPDHTLTHVPIAHSAVVDMVKYSLGFYGHDVVQEDYGVTPDGMRFFGALSLESTYGDYADTIGLRNSHDKKFPIGISFGSRVFVCDNLAFVGDTVIKRRHTANAKRDLPGIVAGVVEPLREKRMAQQVQFERYRATEMSDEAVNQVIMALYRRGSITVTKIADVLANFENPPFDWGARTAWRLFNAVTLALEGRVSENPRATTELHDLLSTATL